MTEEYIKKSDVMDALKDWYVSHIVNKLPVHTFPDAPKEPSLREMIDGMEADHMKEYGRFNSYNQRVVDILTRIASKLEEIERR